MGLSGKGKVEEYMYVQSQRVILTATEYGILYILNQEVLDGEFNGKHETNITVPTQCGGTIPTIALQKLDKKTHTQKSVKRKKNGRELYPRTMSVMVKKENKRKNRNFGVKE